MTDQTQLQSQLVKELGIDTLPPEKQEELLIKMTEVLLKRIFVETMEKLSDTDREAYEKLIDDNTNPDQINNFLQEKIPNYDDMVQKIITSFKDEMKMVG